MVRQENDTRHGGGVRKEFWLTGIFIAVVIIFLVMVPQVSQVPRLERHAINTLRDFSEAMEYYRTRRNTSDYPTWDKLAEGHIIRGSRTSETFLQGYTIEIDVDNSRGGTRNSYAITAIPKPEFGDRLRTFAITNDGIIRWYNCEYPSNVYEDRTTWDIYDERRY